MMGKKFGSRVAYRGRREKCIYINAKTKIQVWMVSEMVEGEKCSWWEARYYWGDGCDVLMVNDDSQMVFKFAKGGIV